MTNICPACQRNCRRSDDRYDARLLVGCDLLVGDHDGQRTGGTIVMARSSSGEAIETRVHGNVAIGLGGDAQEDRRGKV
jgi:hypothetical protein